MTSLAQLLHYTSLSQALFSKPLSPIGPTQPSRGNVTRRIARWAFQDGHLVSFYFIFLFFLVCFLSYFPMLSTFYCLYLEKKNYSICLSLALCLYLLFWFVVLIIVQPPTPLSLFCYSCSLCVIEFCPGCYGIPVGCVSHMGWWGGGSLTLDSLVTYACLT